MAAPLITSPDAALPISNWPYLITLQRLVLALGVGLLVGMEREHRGKDAGLRTFGLVALLGSLAGLMGEAFAITAIALTAVLVLLMNAHTLRANQGTKLTTSVALLVTVFSGVLCGQGHTLTPAAVGVITAALLAWKEPLVGFSVGISEAELRSALLLALLAVVLYPALPTGEIDPWGMFEPRTALITVILIAGIGFVNYILWNLYGDRGIELSGFLGGLVNSSVTVNELAARVVETDGRIADAAYRATLLATAAMLVRNGAILATLAPEVFLGASLSFALMLAACIVLTVSRRGGVPDGPEGPPASGPSLRLQSPFSLLVAVKYGLFFVGLEVAGVLAQRALGHFGMYGVSLIGGLVSSASATAAAGTLASKHSVPVAVAASSAVLASLTSVAVNLPLAVRARNHHLLKKLVRAVALVLLLGALGAFLQPMLFRG